MSMAQTIARTRNPNQQEALMSYALDRRKAKRAARIEKQGRNKDDYKFTRTEPFFEALNGTPVYSNAWVKLMEAVSFGEIDPVAAAEAVEAQDRATLTQLIGIGPSNVARLFEKR